MWTRELLKRNAKEIFKRNYWTCVGVSLVLAALTGGGSSVIGRIGGNNTSVSYHHYGSDYYYGDSARGFMISMAGAANKESRKALLAGLKGHTAFRTKEEAEKFSIAQKEKRAAVKAAQMAGQESEAV